MKHDLVAYCLFPLNNCKLTQIILHKIEVAENITLQNKHNLIKVDSNSFKHEQSMIYNKHNSIFLN